MIDKLSDKELIMLYVFTLESMYLACRPESEKIAKCVLDRHSLKLVNFKEPPEEGKKIPSRRIILENGKEKKTLSLADLFLLKDQTEKRLFGSTKLEKISWQAVDGTVNLEEREDGVRLEVLSEDNPVAMTIRDHELMKLIATTLLTYPTWLAVYPVRSEKLTITADKTGFALARVGEIEVRVGKYPYLNLAILCKRKLT